MPWLSPEPASDCCDPRTVETATIRRPRRCAPERVSFAAVVDVIADRWRSSFRIFFVFYLRNLHVTTSRVKTGRSTHTVRVTRTADSSLLHAFRNGRFVAIRLMIVLARRYWRKWRLEDLASSTPVLRLLILYLVFFLAVQLLRKVHWIFHAQGSLAIKCCMTTGTAILRLERSVTRKPFWFWNNNSKGF